VSELTAEQIVKQKWPRAMCYRARFGLDGVAIYDPPRNTEFEPCDGKMLCDTFCDTESDAWADAAKRLTESK
jgi:hypothetical protein